MKNFTLLTQQLLALSRKEADAYRQNHVGTEHLLLALTRLSGGVAFKVFQLLGLDAEIIRRRIGGLITANQDDRPMGNIPYTPTIRKVLEAASRESHQLGHDHVGTGHILLGIIVNQGNVAAQTLTELGVDLAGVITHIKALPPADLDEPAEQFAEAEFEIPEEFGVRVEAEATRRGWSVRETRRKLHIASEILGLDLTEALAMMEQVVLTRQ